MWRYGPTVCQENNAKNIALNLSFVETMILPSGTVRSSRSNSSSERRPERRRSRQRDPSRARRRNRVRKKAKNSLWNPRFKKSRNIAEAKIVSSRYFFNSPILVFVESRVLRCRSFSFAAYVLHFVRVVWLCISVSLSLYIFHVDPARSFVFHACRLTSTRA